MSKRSRSRYSSQATAASRSHHSSEQKAALRKRFPMMMVGSKPRRRLDAPHASGKRAACAGLRRSSSRYIVAALAACSKPPPPPTPVTFAAVCDDQFDPADDNGLSVQKRVQVEGYLEMSKASFTLCSSTCSLDLVGEPGGKGAGITTYIKVGTGENTMDTLPDRYGPGDIKVRGKDGKLIPLGTKVHLTAGCGGGKAPGGSKKICYLNAELIEAR